MIGLAGEEGLEEHGERLVLPAAIDGGEAGGDRGIGEPPVREFDDGQVQRRVNSYGINPKTGNAHKINFFPKLPEISLEPEWDGPQPNLESGYQIGENPYYLVPTVHRCKHIETGQLLSRKATLKLMQPDILQAAIIAFRDKVENDPAAPAHLAEMLDMWDPDKEYLFHENDDTWESEEEPDIFGEDENEYYEE